ncbi:MAG TPA: DNA/RNA non-specific endonuclease [Microvirga sp.]|jgi:endonuclease G|nr:DNA/RNA non-specific endonuclease [Microvirga sp.]
MGSLAEQLARLRRYNAGVRENDPALAVESRDKGLAAEAFAEEDIDRQIEQESIAMRRERPVLAIKENVTQLVFIDHADSEIWGERLKRARPHLDKAIPTVGRIDLAGGALDWVGTGWLVAEDVIVTNRHVAREFATRDGDGFTFKLGAVERISASVDFLQELDNPDRLVFRLVRPLHIADADGPDVAFFEVEMVSGSAKLAVPVDLADAVVETVHVATIGYPAYDSRIPEPALMERIFGRIYDKKRLAPGAVTRVESTRLWHNCTTLGGNSGSLVLDLDSGRALGLHFSGSFLTTNYAVRADVVRRLLADMRAGRRPRRIEAPDRTARPGASMHARPSSQRRVSAMLGPPTAGGARLTIPLTLTLSVGLEFDRPPTVSRPAGRGSETGAEADFIQDEEGRVEDYRDRAGYLPGFLGETFAVRLPEVTRDADDVLAFELDGRRETELRYEHFSVVMSCSRRMCFLSACNIDGGRPRKSPRAAWRWDPRIDRSYQIMKECYGSPPKFSRGHMTRREDPSWGTPEEAKRGNEDSMHVTNAAPQMQAFNAPIWLALEDYALQHAREDDMKISVFTGPYFSDGDPDMYGVRIPLAFWKVIAFIHDETGELCATGYEMNQEQSLEPKEEFVFGPFTSRQLGVATQVPIRTIETRAGISFGQLAALDPLADEEESAFGDGERPPLLALEQISFVRRGEGT